MTGKSGTIKNPLTIIAVFAGISEISGTSILPFITDANQAIYVWFLMLFPAGLVLLFFGTLWFNPKVLYAPSDFQNEDNYMKLLRPASTIEREEKLRAEVKEIEEELEETSTQDTTAEEVSEPQQSGPIRFSRRTNQSDYSRVRDISARYLLAEELVLNKISKEQSSPIHRGVKLGDDNISMVFDGIIIRGETHKQIIVIEIKYIDKMTNTRLSKLTNEIMRAAMVASSIKSNSVYLIVAIVTETKLTNESWISSQLIPAIGGASNLSYSMRFFDLATLEQELTAGFT